MPTGNNRKTRATSGFREVGDLPDDAVLLDWGVRMPYVDMKH